jgi:membrane fusion protein, multidrug efflux system
VTRPHPKIVRLVLLVLIPASIVLIGGVVWLHGGQTVGTEDAYIKTDMAQIAPEVSGRVVEVLVRDHQIVERGTPLVKLDPEPFRLALDKAEAELDKARTDVETARAQWGETEKELREAENRTEYLMREAARQRALAANGNAAITKLDEAQNTAMAARDRVAIVRSRLARMLAALGGDPEMPTDEHPLVREKKAERDRAKLDLERTTIKAPIGGTAVNVKLQPGEQVRAAMPLFVLVSKTRPWVEANMKETDLTHVKPGQKASVVLDVYPDVTWSAEVESISPASGAEFAILPPQNASGNWVKVVQRLPVRLVLDKPPADLPLHAGLSATVEVDTKHRRPWLVWLAEKTGGLFGTAQASAPAR